MTRETTIKAEAHDLKLLNALIKCIEEAIVKSIEEKNLFDDDDDDYCCDDEWDDHNHDCVCLCDPTDFNAGTCCCNYLGLSCNRKCRPDGYDRWFDSREPINS